MKTVSVVILFLLGSCLSASLNDAAEKRMTMIDYYLLLPRDYLEGTPVDWLRFLKQPKCGVVDPANGYMSCTGEQPPFEIALFRYRDGRPLLAVCQGELEGMNSLFLDFFEIGSDGKMHKARRSIFPVADAGSDAGTWRFELPRQGRTVLVRGQKSGRVLRRLTWNSEKFQEEK
jgi:hypothetical protein